MSDLMVVTNKMLERWGEWSRQRGARVGGYSSVSPMFKQRIASGTYVGDVVLADDVAMAMDKAVAELNARLHPVVMDWYVRQLPAETIARRQKCHLNTVYNRKSAAIAICSNVVVARSVANS